MLVLVVLAVFLGGALPAWGVTPYLGEEELKAEVKRGVEEILDLWRDGKYGELYEHTVASGKKTKEHFGKAMAAAPLRPACCWEKMQEAKVSLQGDSKATVRAKLGFEGGGTTEFKTRSFKLVKEDGVWRLNQQDILTLAEAVKKTKRYTKRKSSTALQ